MVAQPVTMLEIAVVYTLMSKLYAMRIISK